MNVETCHLAGICIFCGHDIPVAAFPWLFARHTVHGDVTASQGKATPGTLCPGSRNIYTLALLGLRELEPEFVPPRRVA